MESDVVAGSPSRLFRVLNGAAQSPAGTRQFSRRQSKTKFPQGKLETFNIFIIPELRDLGMERLRRR
jgi:hypothetical protein